MKKSPKLKLSLLDPKGIPLSELIAVHRQFESKLSQNIGDGYLMEFNPIFRNIRQAFFQYGFSFSSPDPHYDSFPLMSLDDIYSEKKVPVRNNIFWLEELNKIPGLTLTELKKSELQFNYLFHESAHFIAHKILFGDCEMKAVPVTKESLLKILIGESFANTVESLAALYAEGEIGSYFLDANCHYRLSAQEVKVLEKSVKENGFQKTFRLVFASFLSANYLVQRPSKKELSSILKFAGVKKAQKELIGYGLSEIFRTNTTQLHLMKLGFPDDLNGWLDIDPVAELMANKKMCIMVDALGTILCAAK